MSKLTEPNASSFWEIGNFKKVVQRVNDGQALCDDLSACVKERESIEKTYTKSLQSWSKKWEGYLEKSPEFGTLREGWRGLLVEAEGIASAHGTMASQLSSDIEKGLGGFKADKFHKSIIHFKETKQAEDEFEKAQKPWAKLKDRVEECLKKYHLASQTADTLLKRAQEAEGTPEVTPEECRKLNDKAQKAKLDAEVRRKKYEDALHVATEYRSRYEQDMTEVFNKWQEFERTRIEYFKKILLDYQAIVDASQNAQIAQTCQQLRSTLSAINADADLAAYSQQKGVDMVYNWPAFVEWTGSMDDGDSLASNSSANLGTVRSTRPPLASKPSVAQQNTFDEDWDSNSTASSYSASGTRVRAIYDYDATDPDELSFKEGDIIVQTEGEDEQGWCRGSFRGRVGLFPANYVEMA